MERALSEQAAEAEEKKSRLTEAEMPENAGSLVPSVLAQ
jgi:hypothetical protein